jgi:hypothetical protein
MTSGMYVDGPTHGPIFLTQRWPVPLVRAWCVQCRAWVGPERTGDEHSDLLVEDDAITHLHAKAFHCGHCFYCRQDIQ